MKGYEVTGPGIDMPAYLQQVNQGVGQFVDGVRDLVTDQHEYTQAAMGSYIDILEAGGKRLRGVLAICGYEMYGGDNKDMIARAAGIVEGFHASVLVADDVADNATTRRGAPAAHQAVHTFLQHQGAAGDTKKIASDMAITAALTAQNYGQVALMELDAPPQSKMHMARNVNMHLAHTGLGQILDLTSTLTPLSETDIMSITRLKTALYTFQMPLEMGALLAGAGDEDCRRFSEYTLNSGIAFQLHDDVIGTFGAESVTGKSVKSDIAEGKQTLLVARALGAADDNQRRILQNALGNKEISDETFETCRQVITETGALDSVRGQAVQYAERAQDALAAVPDSLSPRHVEFLRFVASYVVQRNT